MKKTPRTPKTATAKTIATAKTAHMKPAAKTTKTTTAKTRTKTTTTAPPISPDARAAYDYFLPAAMHVATGDLVSFRSADPVLARHNCELGVAAIAHEKSRVKDELPRVALAELESLPRLALAVEYAALEATHAPTPTDVKGQLHAAHGLRATLLAIADGLARAGLLPAAEVAQIKKGKGAIDAARDCLSLATLFQKHEKKLAGKHAATAQMLRGAREVGSWLLTTLKPGGARAKTEDGPATEARDRLWSLLVHRHAVLRKVGYYLWGDAFGEHVPALLGRHVVKPKAAAKPTTKATAAKPSTNGASLPKPIQATA